MLLLFGGGEFFVLEPPNLTPFDVNAIVENYCKLHLKIFPNKKADSPNIRESTFKISS